MTALERAITTLVQQAPAIDRAVVDQLLGELARADTPLARAIAEVVELVAAGRVDPGIALPALAMACTTLAGVVAGTLGAREAEAARYEIETLLPVPGAPPARPQAPDVELGALTRLTRGRPPRT